MKMWKIIFTQTGAELVTELHIYKSGITMILETMLAAYTNLNTLRIEDHNHLQIGQNAFTDLNRLKIFSLKNNNLKELPNVMPRYVRVLDVSENQLGASENIATLEEYELPELRTLHLTNISIKTLPNIARMLAKKIVRLYAGNNQITAVNALIFQDCKSLKTIVLSHNPLVILLSPGDVQHVADSLNWLELLSTKLRCFTVNEWKNWVKPDGNRIGVIQLIHSVIFSV